MSISVLKSTIFNKLNTPGSPFQAERRGFKSRLPLQYKALKTNEIKTSRFKGKFFVPPQFWPDSGPVTGNIPETF